MSREIWRLPPLDRLPPGKLSLVAKTRMGALRLYPRDARRWRDR
jgi:hypothetical protein